MGLMFYLCYLYSLFILVSHIFFPCQKLFVLLNSNMTSATSGARTASAYREPDFTHGFQWGSCCSIFGFLFSILWTFVCLFKFFNWQLCCLSSNLWLLVPHWYLQTFSCNSETRSSLEFLSLKNNFHINSTELMYRNIDIKYNTTHTPISLGAIVVVIIWQLDL